MRVGNARAVEIGELGRVHEGVGDRRELLAGVEPGAPRGQAAGVGLAAERRAVEPVDGFLRRRQREFVAARQNVVAAEAVDGVGPAAACDRVPGERRRSGEPVVADSADEGDQIGVAAGEITDSGVSAGTTGPTASLNGMVSLSGVVK